MIFLKGGRDLGEREALSEQIDVALTPDTTKEMGVVKVDHDLITIDGRRYRIVKDHRDAFDLERLNERYNDILDKYDYIVGDWGYDQLRLRGFYKDDRRGASKDQQISTLEDYLYEYCNFGCAYFVLARLDKPATKVADRWHDRERKSATGKTAHRQQSKPTQRQHHANVSLMPSKQAIYGKNDPIGAFSWRTGQNSQSNTTTQAAFYDPST